jgi:hypothetical protein
MLWNQAAIIYYDKVVSFSPPPLSSPPLLQTNGEQTNEFPISFERILQGTDEILRNPIRIKFTLHVSMLSLCLSLFPLTS